MSCRFAHDDAPYVLGALSPGERLDFERHLPRCEDCTRAVRQLAGLPGLLGRVDARVLEDQPDEQPLPPTLLPALAQQEVRRRRRRTVAAAVAASAATAVLAVGAFLLLGGGGDGEGRRDVAAPSGSAQPSGIPSRAMAPVGDVPVRATLRVEPVTWGTRLLLTCSYDPESVEYELPPELDYTLFVRTREGHAEQVGSWRSVGGTTMRLAAATAAKHTDIASVEVRAPDGRVVLRSGA